MRTTLKYFQEHDNPPQEAGTSAAPLPDTSRILPQSEANAPQSTSRSHVANFLALPQRKWMQRKLVEDAKSGKFEKVTKTLVTKSKDVSPELKATALKKAISAWRNGKREALFSALQLISLAPNEKFKFHYEDNEIADKLLKEDQYASEVLKLQESQTSVFDVGNKLLEFLEKHVTTDEMKTNIVQHLNDYYENRRKIYPLPKENFENYEHLISLLTSEGKENDPIHHVKMLSILWNIPGTIRDVLFINLDDEQSSEMKKKAAETHSLYSMMTPTKDYRQKENPGKPRSLRFGHTGRVDDTTFADDHFDSFSRVSDYILINPKSKSYLVQRFMEKNKPYISGLSGMANLAAILFDILEIDPLSSGGKAYCEALSAYIVGSDMHSYPETYKPLNLYIKLQKARQLRDSVE